MKSVSKILCLLTAGSLLASCNEKISPSLQSGSSATVPAVTAPDEYYFRVTNNSPTVLNYKLHRTGAGNKDANCEIKSTSVALSNDLYVGNASVPHNDPAKLYDISCFMEAEELALFFNGLSFNVEASKNTCEYIGYAPFSYFDAIPGTSTSTYYGITCDDTAAAPANSATALAGAPTYTSSAGNVACNEMVSFGLNAGTRTKLNTAIDTKTLCKFDYATQEIYNKQNCDEGTVTINLTSITTTQDATGANIYTPKALAPIVVKCGGNATNCVGGAIRNVSSLSGLMRGMEISNTNLDTNFTKTYSLDKTQKDGQSLYSPNLNIINYRKGLAALDLNYINYSSTSDSNWGDSNFNKLFDPNLMEKYAANKYPDGITPLITNSMITTQINVSTDVYGYPYAADPFLGYSGKKVNPFYTFYCMDRAFDIKARIRMVVREWDRVFPTSTANMELISDSHIVLPPAGERRMDIPFTEEENPGDPGMANLYNDIPDWDDYAPMMRTDTSSTSAASLMSTGSFELKPMVGTIETGGYSYSGWWDPGIFPKIRTN